jgi:hypothetical protein
MQVARYAPIKYLKGMMRIELMGGPWWQTNHLIRQRLVVLDGKDFVRTNTFQFQIQKQFSFSFSLSVLFLPDELEKRDQLGLEFQYLHPIFLLRACICTCTGPNHQKRLSAVLLPQST